MSLLPLVVLLTAAAGPNSPRHLPTPTGCQEDYGSCREDCTIDLGGDTSKHRELTRCMERCERELTQCRERHYTLMERGQKDRAPASKREDPDELYGRPARRDDSSDTTRRGVYRTSEPKPAEPESPPPEEPKASSPEPQPTAKAKPDAKAKSTTKAKPASDLDEDSIPIFDDPEPEPQPRPAATSKPASKQPEDDLPPLEPKKRDISDWDPDEK
jgi:hypothetical protein